MTRMTPILTAAICLFGAVTPVLAQFQPSNAPGAYRNRAQMPTMPGQLSLGTSPIPLGSSPIVAPQPFPGQFPGQAPFVPFRQGGFFNPGFVNPGFFGFGYGYMPYTPYNVQRIEIVQQPPPEPAEPPTMPARSILPPTSAPVNDIPPNRAVVSFQVPEDSELWVEGQQMDQTGRNRTFQTPTLMPGRDYVYEVIVRWEQSGEQREWKREIIVTPGEEKSVLVLGQ